MQRVCLKIPSPKDALLDALYRARLMARWLLYLTIQYLGLHLRSRQCCCGHGGMKVSVDPCPHCGIARCPNCNTQRFHIRGSNGLPAPEDEDDFQA